MWVNGGWREEGGRREEYGGGRRRFVLELGRIRGGGWRRMKGGKVGKG